MNPQKLLQLKEMARIIKDTPYALKTYLQTFDNTQKKYVPLELFDDQLKMLVDFENHNENITKKYRQAGVTTVTAAWISKKLQLADKKSPERVLILANKRDTAIEMANKIRAFLEQWPEWMNVGFDITKNSESRYRLNNGCEVKAVATSGDALRGYTPTILIFDEAAYIEAGEQFWAASMASLSTGGKIILISTPNGQDPIYYAIYDQSIRGLNDFHISDLKWYHDPRYTKDLRWVKVPEIVHYMLNREEYIDEDITVYCDDKSEYERLISEGYRPFSSWFYGMSKKFLFDKRKISQELECLDFHTLITVRDKKTGKVKKINIGELYNDFLKTKINTKYDILTPNGFEHFDGIQKLKKKTIELFFDNGITIRGSFNHQIYDYSGNSIILSDIKIGDKIKSHDGFLIVKNIKKNYNKTNVFDIINSGKNHTFYSNGIISHNCDFLGSGDSVIPMDVRQRLTELVTEPKEKYIEGNFWQWKEPIIGHRYIIGCLPPGEKVMTDEGLLSIETVDINNKLIDEDGNYTKIKNKQIYDVVDEDVYEVKVDNTYRTTKFTKEHPLYVSSPILKRNWKRHDPNIVFKTRFWNFNFQYKKIVDVNINDWIKVPNIYKKPLSFDINEKWNNGDKIRKDFIIESPLSNKDLWWFIGLWLGDGWIGKYKFSHSITICFNKKEYYYVEKCKEIVKSLFNREPTIVESESTFEMTFNSKELYYFILENFGQYSHGKKISEWVKYIPNDYKKELIKGYFDSDGCWLKTMKNGKINSKISFVSINLELLEGIQDILFSLGILSSLNKLRDSSVGVICGRHYKTKITFDLTLVNHDSISLIKLLNDQDDIKLNRFDINEFSTINKRIISSCHFDENYDYIYFRIKKIIKTKYTGKVYNFETDSHTFMCHHITTHNCDVSRGDSDDFSSINIIDFDENEQVAEYIGKLPPDDLANVVYKWGILYGEPLIVVDITGGMGVGTVRKLQDLGYKNLYVEGVNSMNIWEYNKKALEKIPGINFNNKRIQIISAFEEQLRHGFKTYSLRLLNEMSTFIYINGRADHMKGAHDDAIMSLSIAMYVGEICFNQLKRNESANKAMLESWVLSERTYDPNQSLYSYGGSFDQIGVMSMNNSNFNPTPTNVIKQNYQEYSWLFGKNKK